MATNRKPDKPAYAQPWTDAARYYGWDGLEHIDWLDFGLQFRSQYSYVENSYRFPADSPFDRLGTRLLAYVGIREIIDPFRAGVEFEDMREFFSPLPAGPGTVNQTDLLQAHAELYFRDVFLPDQPLSLRGGRMSFDSVDRRLLARNRFRNTINSFDGFRVRWGTERSVWEADLFAMQPVEISTSRADRRDEGTWFSGITGYLRAGSPHVVVEPYYLHLNKDMSSAAGAASELHTLGFHAFGLIQGTPLDYDVHLSYQFGDQGGMDHQAWAGHAELGYRLEDSWKTRLALWLNYATGDRDPNDDSSQRFDTLFGVRFAFYGFTGLFNWQNTINPAIQLSTKPCKSLSFDLFYRAMWLESATDAWVAGRRVDPTGESGRFVGQEIDLRGRYRFRRNVEVDVGYGLFLPGTFVENTGPAFLSHLIYAQLTLTF